MRTRWLRGVVLLVIVLAAVSGCAGEPSVEEGEKATGQVRAQVVDEVRELADVLRRSDVNIAGARGELQMCGTNGLGVATYEYAATLRVGPSRESTASRIAQIADLLVDTGWKDTTPDPPDAPGPYAQLRRSHVYLTVGEDTDRAGAVLEDGSLSLGLSSRCVKVTDEQVGEFEGVEDIDLGGR